MIPTWPTSTILLHLAIYVASHGKPMGGRQLVCRCGWYAMNTQMNQGAMAFRNGFFHWFRAIFQRLASQLLGKLVAWPPGKLWSFFSIPFDKPCNALQRQLDTMTGNLWVPGLPAGSSLQQISTPPTSWFTNPCAPVMSWLTHLIVAIVLAVYSYPVVTGAWHTALLGDAWALFTQLDRDGDAEVNVDEFLEGCMLLKGLGAPG